jgi:hypothetical protein
MNADNPTFRTPEEERRAEEFTKCVADNNRLEAALRASQAENKRLREALEFYATGQHFEWFGEDQHEPETVSGEPTNWLAGGDDGSEFQYECGAIAYLALADCAQSKKESREALAQKDELDIGDEIMEDINPLGQE